MPIKFYVGVDLTKFRFNLEKKEVLAPFLITQTDYDSVKRSVLGFSNRAFLLSLEVHHLII